MPNGMLRLRDIERAEFVAAWDELAQQASEPNPFYESWYLLPSLREFGPQTRIFAAHAGELLIGVLPLMPEFLYGRWPVPHTQNWLHPNIFLGSPLVRSGYELDFWQQLLEESDRHPGRAMFLHIDGMPSEGVLAKALEECAKQERRRFAMVSTEERAFLQSELSPEEYCEKSMRSKKRKELRRQKRRLGELGTLTFTRSDGAIGIDAWTQEFLALESSGWKGAQASALDSAPETRRLFADALKGAAARGRLELLDLRLDGKPLAMLANFVTPPGSFSFKTTFDEAYFRFSPGVLLQIENLELLGRENVEWSDSCAAQGHPMIDSIWSGRRRIGRFSIAIGGAGRRKIFGAYLGAELARARRRNTQDRLSEDQGS